MTEDELRAFVLSLPAVEERETWGEATFRVRGKMFVVLGEGGGETSLKATLAAQAALVASYPGTFRPAAYVGRYGWVSVRLADVDPQLMRELVVEAWQRTAPRRLVAAYEARQER